MDDHTRLTRWTVQAEARIVHAGARLAPSPDLAAHLCAWIDAARTGRAGLPVRAGDGCAGVRHANAVDAELTAGAGDRGARGDAATISAERARRARNPRAGIGQADLVDAALSLGAPEAVAGVRDTLPICARLALSALDLGAWIDALAAANVTALADFTRRELARQDADT